MKIKDLKNISISRREKDKVIFYLHANTERDDGYEVEFSADIEIISYDAPSRTYHGAWGWEYHEQDFEFDLKDFEKVEEYSQRKINWLSWKQMKKHIINELFDEVRECVSEMIEEKKANHEWW